MCRNIKTLFNIDPPVSDDEVRAAALQSVRKTSGFNQTSKANEAVFLAAVDTAAAASNTLLRSLATNIPPHDRRAVQARLTEPQFLTGSENGFREIEIARTCERNAQRFPLTRQEKT